MLNLVEYLKVHQPAYVVTLGEALSNFQLMLGDATDNIIVTPM